MLTKSIAMALMAFGTVGLTSVNADAAVHHYLHAAHHYSRCDDMGFARVGGGWVADPVCQSELAAHVAHKRGEHYSAAEPPQQPRCNGRILPWRDGHQPHDGLRSLQ